MYLKWLFICFLCFSVLSNAQNNLVIVDENGQKFILLVDGKQVNDSAQAEVKVANIYDDTCRITVLFTDKNIPEFNAKIYLELGSRSVSRHEFMYGIHREKGKTRLRYISTYNALSDTTAKVQSAEARINSVFVEEERKKEEQNRLNEIYPPPVACKKAMADSVLEKKLQVLRDNHVEINRIKDGKWFISNNCINAAQLKKLMGVYNYRNSKVQIAEFAFDYIEDHRNFLVVVDAVEFDTEKEILKKFYHKHIEK